MSLGKKLLGLFYLIFVLNGCKTSEDKKIDSNLGIPKIYLPEGWITSKQDCSDSTYAIINNNSEVEKKKFTENIIIYKPSTDVPIHILLQKYTDDLKSRINAYKFSEVKQFNNSDSYGLIVEYIFKARNTNLGSTIYVCKIRGAKTHLIITHTALNEPDGLYDEKEKVFAKFLDKTFN